MSDNNQENQTEQDKQKDVSPRKNGRFVKGFSGNPSGRKKGSKNKTPLIIKQAFEQLVSNNLENMSLWLEQVAEQDPAKALLILEKFSEYCLPKLSRTEVSGVDGDPIQTQSMSISLNINDQTQGILNKMQKKGLPESKAQKVNLEVNDNEEYEVITTYKDS